MELACTTTLRRGDDERVKLAVGELLDAAATKLRAPALADARIDAPIRAYVGQIFTTLCMRGDWCENEWCDAAVPHLLTLMGESCGPDGDAPEDALARADEAALAVRAECLERWAVKADGPAELGRAAAAGAVAPLDSRDTDDEAVY